MDVTDIFFTLHLYMDKIITIVMDNAFGAFVAVDQTSTSYPFMWNTFSTALFCVSADVLVQILHDRQHDMENWIYDTKRSARIFPVGLVIGGLSHFWYQTLDDVFPSHQLDHVIIKVLADQIIAAASFCTIYIFSIGFLEGQPLQGLCNEWRLNFVEIYKSDCLFWPAAQFVNFLFVPDRFRIFYVNIATVLWNMFLSYITHKSKREKNKLDFNSSVTASPPPTDSPLVKSRSCLLPRLDSLRLVKSMKPSQQKRSVSL